MPPSSGTISLFGRATVRPRITSIPVPRQKSLRSSRTGVGIVGLKAFLAESDGRTAGSVACQLHISPFPEVIMPAHRLLGYVWSVYVEPDFRRKGVARRLMEAAIGHLKELGCTIAVLHSSDAGEKLYEELGFERAKEMRLKL